MSIEMHGHNIAKYFAMPLSELRDSMINFVKILLILTFLPTGTSDALGKENITLIH